MNVTVPEQRDSALGSPLCFIVACLVFAPVFFQLDGQLFSDPASLTAPRGRVTNLPLPLSVLVCAFVLTAMPHRWLRHPQTLALISAVPLMFLTSSVAGSGEISWPKTKLLLFQFAVPMAGFAVGRELGRDEESVARTGKCILTLAVVIAIAQLSSTWFRHKLHVLSSNIFGIEVYGHLQYVPVILMAAYVIGVFAVCARGSTQPTVAARAVLFAPVMGLYLAASMSMTALFGLWTGLLLLSRMPVGPRHRRLVLTVFMMTVVVASVYVAAATSKSVTFQAKFLGLREDGSGAGRPESPEPEPARFYRDSGPRLLPNLSERFLYWDYFLAGSTSNLRTFLVGHAEQPDIRRYPSAHNYYLDFLYNFGLVALIPVVLVIAWTARDGWRARREVGHSLELIGLAFVTFFLLFADNGLRVGMRQPYSGISTFFLWGLLSARLDAKHQASLSRRLARCGTVGTPVRAGSPLSKRLSVPRRTGAGLATARLADEVTPGVGSAEETTGSSTRHD